MSSKFWFFKLYFYKSFLFCIQYNNSSWKVLKWSDTYIFIDKYSKIRWISRKQFSSTVKKLHGFVELITLFRFCESFHLNTNAMFRFVPDLFFLYASELLNTESTIDVLYREHVVYIKSQLRYAFLNPEIRNLLKHFWSAHLPHPFWRCLHVSKNQSRLCNWFCDIL